MSTPVHKCTHAQDRNVTGVASSESKRGARGLPGRGLLARMRYQAAAAVPYTAWMVLPKYGPYMVDESDRYL